MLSASQKQILVYGLSLAALLYVLNFLQYRFLVFDYSIEIFSGLLAVLFTSLGVWLALKLRKPQIEKVVVEKQVYIKDRGHFQMNEDAVEAYGISKRELEVLQLMAEGLSNEEIADKLFISLPTVKSHASRLFSKLDVKRRTQAVEQARKENLIA